MLTFAALLLLALSTSEGADWPDYRGPNLDGTVEASVPLEWSEEDNVTFKTPLPGRGWSSPILAGGKAWMTTADPKGMRLSVLAVDTTSGELTVERELFQVAEPQHRNSLNSFASPSPTVLEGRVFVTFGYGGTAALDARTGETLWTRTDLVVDHMEGPGSSPFVHGGMVLLHFDGGDAQFLVALDPEDGETVWRRERTFDLDVLIPDRRKAYSTPIVVRQGGMDVLVSTGAEATYGYEVDSGDQLWMLEHGGFSMASRPLAAHGHVYLTTGYMRPSLLALRFDPEKAEAPEVAWRSSKGIPTMPSPVPTPGGVWFVSDGGIATCFDPATGEERWKERVGSDTSASPIFTNGHLFFFDRHGQATVVRPGEAPEVVGENQLESGFMATPAVLGDAWLMRTETHLYRIEG